MQGRFALAVTGDTVINMRLSVYDDENFLSLVKIIREADAAFTHFETVIHDYDGPEVYPSAIAGGTWMRSPRFVVNELKWMGFDIVSCASNHALDYSYGGMFCTMKTFEEACIAYAGIGKNLAEAREPVYLETVNGRVALISACSSFPIWAAAGESRPDVKGRPGLNPLHYYHVVDSNTMRTLEDLASKLGLTVIRKGNVRLFNRRTVETLVQKFKVGDGSEIYHEAEKRDVEANLRSVNEARKQADYVLVNLHSHECEPGEGYQPARFVRTFAKACIDAGADVFMQQGAHRGIGGVEIYKSRPIIYDPSDFINMSNSVTRLPADFYSNEQWADVISSISDECTPSGAFEARSRSEIFKALKQVEEGVVPICIFNSDGLKEIKLHPITLLPGRSFSIQPAKRGRPMLAKGEKAKEILEYFGKMSHRYGVKVSCEDGVGFVKL